MICSSNFNGTAPIFGAIQVLGDVNSPPNGFQNHRGERVINPRFWHSENALTEEHPGSWRIPLVWV